ncbi:MAG: hypothetical protein ACOC2F_04490 [Bacteroidota bacterium]
MAMTDEEKKEAYLAWINSETNQDYTLEDAPATVNLAIEKLMEMDENQVNIKSKSKGGRSVTFVEGVPDLIYELIGRKKRLDWMGEREDE